MFERERECGGGAGRRSEGGRGRGETAVCMSAYMVVRMDACMHALVSNVRVYIDMCLTLSPAHALALKEKKK